MRDGINEMPNVRSAGQWLRAPFCIALPGRRLLAAAIMSIGLTAPAHAEDAPAAAAGQDAGSNGLFQQDSLTGDWSGYRKTLENDGIVLGADEVLDVLGNPWGGASQGAAVEGRFEVFANVDLGQALGWTGLTFHANAYEIHGQGLSSSHLGNLLTVSNIEAQPSARLFALWLQQELFDKRISIRTGQIADDDEFFVSQYGSLFINSTFGWPGILGINLPSGGPAYPLATPGVRIKAALSPALVVTAAALNGDPAPPGAGAPQSRDPSGTTFRLNGDQFFIGEAAYGFDAGTDTHTLPGTLKVGAWYHDGIFADQRFDTSGLSLANPQSNGIPAPHRGDVGGYAVVDQVLWRPTGTSDRGLSGFIRLGGDPANRNLVEFHADTGLSYTGLFQGRDTDVIGIAVAYERISDAQQNLARDQRAFGGVDVPLPDFESALELSYQTQIAPWWLVQPDAQVIFHPGARIVNLSVPASGVKANAAIFGIRTAVSF
jgi:porin